MKKFCSILILSVCFVGTSVAAQPKILEIEDNLGNTYDFSEYQDTTNIGGLSPGETISVTDQTTISLCVTKVKAENPDDLSYDWRAVRPRVESTRGENEQSNKCATWILDREDYQSYWTFRVDIDNGDEIQPNGDSDYMGGVRYDNLELADSEEATNTEEFQKVLVEKETWEERKQRVEQNSELQGEIEEKNETIDELQNTISQLENRIDALQSTVNELNKSKSDQTSEEGNSGDVGLIGGIMNVFQ